MFKKCSFILILILILSCDKKNKGGFASATVNGVEFVSQSGSYEVSTLLNDTIYNTKTIVILAGSKGERIELYIPGEQEGVYNLGFDIVPYAIYFDGKNAIHTSVTGIINVTDYNTSEKLVFGTFSFQAQSDIDGTIVSIENGQFSEIPKSD